MTPAKDTAAASPSDLDLFCDLELWPLDAIPLVTCGAPVAPLPVEVDGTGTMVVELESSVLW